MDRQGQLSSFPTSADQFAVKVPYDNSKTTAEQDADAIEQSNHFNHMFDAAVKIENYVLSGSGGVGGLVVSKYSYPVDPNDVVHPNLKMAYATITLSMTGNTITATALVPAAFGDEPFKNKGFSMSHSTYVTPRGATSAVEGIWANTNWGANGPFNDTFKWYQFFNMIRPVTGRTFELTVTNLPLHSTSESVQPTFTDNMVYTSSDPNSIQNIPSRTGWNGSATNRGLIALSSSKYGDGYAYWKCYCEYNDNKAYGWIWPKSLPENLTNSYVEFEVYQSVYETNEDRAQSFIDTNEIYSRLGPMVRANGTLASASFYCLAIGDVARDSLAGAGKTRIQESRTGRLLKVIGTNLSTAPAGKPTSGTAWSTGTTVTVLASAVDLNTANRRYRLQASGTTISVLQADSPYSSWSVAASATDATLASGMSGFFAQAMDDSSARGITFKNDLTITSLTSSPLTVSTQLLFLQVEPESKLTMDTV